VDLTYLIHNTRIEVSSLVVSIIGTQMSWQAPGVKHQVCAITGSSVLAARLVMAEVKKAEDARMVTGLPKAELVRSWSAAVASMDADFATCCTMIRHS
jgi:hypothetical protein